MAQTVLITGGAGYIGSHTCKALAKAGYIPVVYDNLSTGHEYAVKWGPFIQGDLSDKATLSQAFITHNPIAVIHFAASALVAESVTDPGKYYRNNVASTLCLLETMRDHGVQKLIFSSTCAIYGNPVTIPINEKHPQNPINPYGRSKLMIEQMIADFEAAHGLTAVILRYFNAAGADLETQIGENHAPETHLIPSVIQVALGLNEEVIVYGTDFETKDGSAIRDYIHVQDLADAHVAALSCPHSIALNLGTGTGHSVFEVIDAVQKFCGKVLPVRLENRRIGDPSILTADNSKAFEILNWQPQVSDLPSIVESAWKWHQLLFASSDLVKAALTDKPCS
jgi:UDP-arabinose 4-epimerase